MIRPTIEKDAPFQPVNNSAGSYPRSHPHSRVSPEVREVWKQLYRLAKRRPDVSRRARALASNLLLVATYPHTAYRSGLAEQVAALGRALVPCEQDR